MFKFGVDSLIWTEEFTEKDLPLLKKARSFGFSVMDINIGHPERFPVKAVKKAVKEAGIEVVTTIGLPADSNPIDPKPAVRKHAGIAVNIGGDDGLTHRHGFKQHDAEALPAGGRGAEDIGGLVIAGEVGGADAAGEDDVLEAGGRYLRLVLRA